LSSKEDNNIDQEKDININKKTIITPRTVSIKQNNKIQEFDVTFDNMGFKEIQSGQNHNSNQSNVIESSKVKTKEFMNN